MKVGDPPPCNRCGLFGSRWSLTKWTGPDLTSQGLPPTPILNLSGRYCNHCYDWLNTRANFVEYVTLKTVTARLTS